MDWTIYVWIIKRNVHQTSVSIRLAILGFVSFENNCQSHEQRNNRTKGTMIGNRSNNKKEHIQRYRVWWMIRVINHFIIFPVCYYHSHCEWNDSCATTRKICLTLLSFIVIRSISMLWYLFVLIAFVCSVPKMLYVHILKMCVNWIFRWNSGFQWYSDRVKCKHWQSIHTNVMITNANIQFCQIAIRCAC